MALREEHWKFWGINKAKKACEILLKNHIRFRIETVGEEWLQRKPYLLTELYFTIDDSDGDYKQIHDALTLCAG